VARLVHNNSAATVRFKLILMLKFCIDIAPLTSPKARPKVAA
jgi:hypothetical protein